MLDFIIKYWVQFLFGLVAACITFAIKKYYDTKKKEQERGRAAFKEEIVKAVNEDIQEQMELSDEADQKINEQLNMLHETVDSLTKGVLSMQGKIFKEDCRRLLDPEHIITETEYEELIIDHEAYNGLGGNHIGDRLFNSVAEKWRLQMKQSIYDANEE